MEGAVLSDIGLSIIGIFVFTIFFTSLFKRDWNIQESRFKRGKEVVYLEDDDRWYAGQRVTYKLTRKTVLNWIVGKQLISMRNGRLKWFSKQDVLEYENIFRPPEIWTLLPARRKVTDVENGVSPLFGNYMRAYTPLSAFLINNLIVGFSTAFASEIRQTYAVDSSFDGFSITFCLTFLTGTGAMLAFFHLFGYGEGLLAPKKPKVLSNELVRTLFKGTKTVAANEAFVLTETSNFFAPRLKYNYITKVYVSPPRMKCRARVFRS